MLELKSISKRYGQKLLFHDINLKLPGQTIIGVCGLNGSGKSSLLRLIAGLDTPTHGEIGFRLDDENTGSQVRSLAWAQQNNLVGYSGLPHCLVGNLQVRENIYYACKLRNLPNPKQLTEATLENHRLASHAKQLANKLSKGYAQRLGLALAMLHQPSLLILDEPFDGIDELEKRDLREMLLAEKHRGLIVIASHDMSDLDNLCDSVYVLHKQKLFATVPENEQILFQANFASAISADTLTYIQTRFSARQLHDRSLVFEFSQDADAKAEAALAVLHALPDESLIEFRCLTQSLQEQVLSIMSQ